MRDRVIVVTPSLNSAEFIDRTIASVVAQEGDFEVTLHVQDGGSTDGTVQIVEAWLAKVAVGGASVSASRTRLTIASAPDGSMYEAIQAGFDHCRAQSEVDRPRDVMTWLNSDDVLVPGALQTAVSFFAQAQDQEWATGIPSTIGADGRILDVRDPPWEFSRRRLATGSYDGRTANFVQQEGTFWTRSLWDRVGGLNTHLRLAGDWDLWRRMAQLADLVSLKAVLAHHRRRPRQLSANLAEYWREVDAILRATSEERAAPREGDHGLIAWYDVSDDRWRVAATALTSELNPPSVALSDAFTWVSSDSRLPAWVERVAGLSWREPWGRWSDSSLSPCVEIALGVDVAGPLAIHLRLSVADPSCNPVTVTVGSHRLVFTVSVEPTDYIVDLEALAMGDVLAIEASRSVCPKELGWSEDRRRLGVGFCRLELAPEGPAT